MPAVIGASRKSRSIVRGFLAVAAGVIALALGLSCSSDSGSEPDDTTAPLAIADLEAVATGCSSVSLTWTAPGDDVDEGRAASYDVRYSTAAITQGNWASATPCDGEPEPRTAGQAETFPVTGLSSGATYHFACKTTDDNGNESGLSNDADAAIGTGDVAWVNDGLGADEDWSTSATSLSANWQSAVCVTGYEYGIGATSGATDVVPWTACSGTSVTHTGLTVVEGQTYFFTVRGVAGATKGTPIVSDGIGVDVTAPTSEVDYLGEQQSTPEFTVSWHGTDAVSGLKYYDVQVSTDGGTSWSDWFTATVYYAYSFTGANGQTYHFRSRAYDNAGNIEAYPATSDAHTTVNLSTSIAWVYDGLGADEDWTASANTLSANWAAADYAESYDYAIGTSSGATDVVDWTPAGNQTSVTRAGLSLADGETYYFSVRAVYGGEPAAPTSSSGITVDITAPASAIDALPSEVPTEIFTITWGGSDATSGIQNYDIQVSTNGGVNWVDWIPATTLTSASYPGEVDGDYHFRSRARDNVGNLEAYPATSDAHTTVNRALNLQVAYVNDGTGDDIDWTNSYDMLHLNWPGVSGAEGYEYAIGMSPGAADHIGWTSVGSQTSASVGPYYLNPGYTYYASVRAFVGVGRGPAVSSDGVTTDWDPPASSVDSLEAAIPALSFLVHWTGTDDISGISHYNIQYKDNAGDWYDWLPATQLATGYFYGELDHTYYFRSQAVDSAGNVETPHVAADAHACLTCTFAYERDWGQEGTGEGDFKWPFNVAVDALGDVFVAESEGARVQVFDPDGNFLRGWGEKGYADTQFVSLAGVAVDDSGYVYVTDFGGNKVKKFTSDGAFVKAWGEHGSGEDQMIYPRGIAVDDSFYVYVAEQGNERVHKFTSNGVSVKIWGGQGTDDGLFDGLMSVAVAPSGDIYALDSYSYRIQQFTSDGAFVRKWGSFGGGDGEFSSMGFIAVDASGHVYVTQGNDCRIQRFTADGVFLNKWGGCGSGDGQFLDEPFGIAIHTDGTVYVTDLSAHRVVKFVPTCP